MYDEETGDQDSDTGKYQKSSYKSWSKEEDDHLREAILVKRLSNWEKIAEQLDRTPKECCKRFVLQYGFTEGGDVVGEVLFELTFFHFQA
jgi:hypothetical protein